MGLFIISETVSATSTCSEGPEAENHEEEPEGQVWMCDSVTTDSKSDSSILQRTELVTSPKSCTLQPEAQNSHEELLLKVRNLEEEVKQLRGKVCTLTNEVPAKVENILKPLFSKTQIKVLLDNNKNVRQWTDEDISSALTLRSLSPSCYNYLRDKKGFPLPCKSTLHNRAKHFQCEPGILSSVLSLMKAKAETLEPTEKLSVLSLDEMSLVSQWSYDRGMDRLYKPHGKVQVVMLRGLVSKWKQPIYFEYDESNIHKILLSLIEKIECTGYHVMAVVHDLGPTNLRIWKEFGIDPLQNKISIKNPCAGREIFFFADAPHMIKLIRNNFIDSGFVMKDGTNVSDQSIREMLLNTKSEYGLAYKLSEVHLNVSGMQRQRVKYAAQLLSKTSANSIRYLGERGLLETRNWEETANFISLVDEWFDIMNSSAKYGDVPSRNAFGTDLENNQINILHKMSDMMETMRVQNSRPKGLYPFQKGIILSCKSLVRLLERLNAMYNLEFIITQRLNQDSLEHFFGCIRQMSGPHDHPNAVDFKHRLKKFLLGREVSLVSEKNNSSSTDENSECLSRELVAVQNSDKDKIVHERELALEICLTSLAFKNMDFELENEKDATADLDDLTSCPTKQDKIAVLTTSDVIEEESLRYIGGYIVKKFAFKYPYLGLKVIDKVSSSCTKTWTEMINKGGLHIPSDDFLSKLTVMREVVTAIHGKGLREGKCCVKTLISDINQAGVDLPLDVITFFARISIYFKMKYLNKAIDMNKRKSRDCRSMARKRMKTIR